MRFLLDIHLPVRLAVYLREKGHDCVPAQDVGLGEAADIDLWRWAEREGRIVISKDEDLTFLALRPGDAGRLVWIRLGNCRTATLLSAIEAVHDEMVRSLESGQRIVEVV